MNLYFEKKQYKIYDFILDFLYKIIFFISDFLNNLYKIIYIFLNKLCFCIDFFFKNTNNYKSYRIY